MANNVGQPVRMRKNYCPVLVGSIGGARWGRAEIDEALYAHHDDLVARLRWKDHLTIVCSGALVNENFLRIAVIAILRWCLLIFAYGIVTFWDSPYRLCDSVEGYCGKYGNRIPKLNTRRNNRGRIFYLDHGRLA